jgi:hypothetical protein
MTARVQIPRSPAIAAWAAEAEAMEIGLPLLLTADLTRLRATLRAATPTLTDWEWNLISHVIDDEGALLIADRDRGEQIVSGDRLHVGIVEWADGASEPDMMRAEQLARRARDWTDIERWSLMVRRDESSRLDD